MKKIIIHLLLLLQIVFIPLRHLSGQNKIYINKFTEEFKPVMHGDYEKTTDKYERGTVKITTEGPIKYTINPPDLVIFENETKKWTGMIYPDMKALPAPGDSANATITADYSIVYSRPEPIPGIGGGVTVLNTFTCGKCLTHPSGGKHQLVRQNDTKQFHFTIYSINLEVPDTLTICALPQTLHIKGIYPKGGELTLEDDNPSLTIDFAADTSYKIDFNPKYPAYRSTSKIKVTYKINEVSMSKICVVKLGPRSPAEELARLKEIFCEAVDAIRPSFPTLGQGYLGNIIKSEGLCIIINDSIAKHVKSKMKDEKFCHYHLGPATYFNVEWLGIGHTFSCITDRKGKLYQYADPWKFNDCKFRKPPSGSDTWIVGQW